AREGTASGRALFLFSERHFVNRLDHPAVRGWRRAAPHSDVDVRLTELAVPREVEHAALLIARQAVGQWTALQVVLEAEGILPKCAVRHLRGRRGARAALVAGE